MIDYWVTAGGVHKETNILIDHYTVHVKINDKSLSKNFFTKMDWDWEATKLFSELIKTR